MWALMAVTTCSRGSLKKVLKTFQVKLNTEISNAASASHEVGIDVGSGAMRGALHLALRTTRGLAVCQWVNRQKRPFLNGARHASENVVFPSRLHNRPRNSGVVQTSMDIEMSEVPCTRRALCSIVLCTKLPDLLLWRLWLSCCRDPSVEGRYGDS